jgi:hypothetical protein
MIFFGANFISGWIRIRIRNADPDPGDISNADPCGSETLASTADVAAKLNWQECLDTCSGP